MAGKAASAPPSRCCRRAAAATSLGVIVQTNFGGNLTIDGVPIWKSLGRTLRRADARHRARAASARGDGSCMIVIATDAPLDLARPATARRPRRLRPRPDRLARTPTAAATSPSPSRRPPKPASAPATRPRARTHCYRRKPSRRCSRPPSKRRRRPSTTPPPRYDDDRERADHPGATARRREGAAGRPQAAAHAAVTRRRGLREPRAASPEGFRVASGVRRPTGRACLFSSPRVDHASTPSNR